MRVRVRARARESVSVRATAARHEEATVQTDALGAVGGSPLAVAPLCRLKPLALYQRAQLLPPEEEGACAILTYIKPPLGIELVCRLNEGRGGVAREGGGRMEMYVQVTVRGVREGRGGKGEVVGWTCIRKQPQRSRYEVLQVNPSYRYQWYGTPCCLWDNGV